MLSETVPLQMLEETCDLGIPYLGLGLGLRFGIRSMVRVRARVRVT